MDEPQALRRILDVTEERKMDIGEATFYNENGMDRKKQYFAISFELTIYEEHALSHGSSSKAMAYVGITNDNKWFIGLDRLKS